MHHGVLKYLAEAVFDGGAVETAAEKDRLEAAYATRNPGSAMILLLAILALTVLAVLTGVLAGAGKPCPRPVPVRRLNPPPSRPGRFDCPHRPPWEDRR
jgi:hypothetical protein